MFSSNTLRQFATYRVSIPTIDVPSKLARETVYMPSRIATLVLGTGCQSFGLTNPIMSALNERQSEDRTA